MGMKLNEKEKDYVPGPGQYEHSPGKDTPAYAFGSAQRDQMKDSGLPGPGQYSHQGIIGKDSQGRTIGMRLHEKDKDYVPGPGQYEMRKTVGEGPKWVVGS